MSPKVICDCGEERWITVTEDISKAIEMLEWLVEHWSKHKLIYSETDLLQTLTVKTPTPEADKD